MNVIEQALTLVQTLSRSKNVELAQDIPNDLPLIPMDANQIQQVIINLCTNAIDAMPSGGTLTVGASTKENNLEISVKDTGTGVPREIRDRIFEAFFTTKEVGKGTGLGLSLIANIVKNHNGKIDFNSEIDKGTMFVVTLPRNGQALSKI